MDDIIRQLAGQLGIKPDQAESGAGAVMNLIRENASKVDFQELLGAVPQAKAWMGKAAQPDGEDGGLLGQAAGLLGALGGSGAGGAGGGIAGIAGLLATLGKAGLSAETVAKFVPALLEILQSKAGREVIERLAGQVPALQALLGGLGGGGEGGKGGGIGGEGDILGSLAKIFG